ncbi:MAG: phosphoglycerate kinase [Nitriliruptorales bacterium]|nr:phosphoglycerate kinase [Nitriliruptorales bacterium]
MPAILDGVPTLADLDASGRTVFLRADLNVPLAGREVADELRIEASLETIQELLEQGAAVVLASHLGRPGGDATARLSLRPVAERLAGHLDREVQLSEDVAGPDARSRAAQLGAGEVLLLENLRFDPGEKANDEDFGAALAGLADVYVDDAFGATHRAHASIVGVPAHLPGYAGRLLERELTVLGRLLEDPPRPYVAVLGGAKVSDKLGVLGNLLERVDAVAIGGAMCFTFLRAEGYATGLSRVEEDQVDAVGELVEDARERGVDVHLPIDIVVADEFEEQADAQTVTVDAIPEDRLGLDIGPKSSDHYAEVIRAAGSVFWNGPMGVFEWERFANGTETVAAAMAHSEGWTVVGGGDSAAAIRKLGYDRDVAHVSTGGGAALNLLEGVDLPGVAALRR